MKCKLQKTECAKSGWKCFICLGLFGVAGFSTCAHGWWSVWKWDLVSVERRSEEFSWFFSWLKCCVDTAWLKQQYYWHTDTYINLFSSIIKDHSCPHDWTHLYLEKCLGTHQKLPSFMFFLKYFTTKESNSKIKSCFQVLITKTGDWEETFQPGKSKVAVRGAATLSSGKLWQQVRIQVNFQFTLLCRDLAETCQLQASLCA